jgi:hypothetical protein
LIYNLAIYTVVHFYSNFWRFCQSNSAERNESGDPRRDAALRRSGTSFPRACARRVAPRRLSVWDPHDAARPEARMPRFHASSRLEGRARTCRLLAPRRAGPSPRRTRPYAFGSPSPSLAATKQQTCAYKRASFVVLACVRTQPSPDSSAGAIDAADDTLTPAPLSEVPNHPKLHSRPHRSSSTHTLAGYAPALAGHLAATANAAWLRRADSLAPTQPQLWPRINQRWAPRPSRPFSRLKPLPARPN